MEHFALHQAWEGRDAGQPDFHFTEVLDRPFAPTHGPGDDPYVIHEYGSDLQRRTAFTGRVNS